MSNYLPYLSFGLKICFFKSKAIPPLGDIALLFYLTRTTLVSIGLT